MTVGQNVTFSATAGGTPTLSYQWQFDGTNIAGATTTMFTLANVQLGQAGSYALVVTNLAGSITSSNALLTVNPVPVCVPPPSELVSWWPGESDANDIAGGNNGTLSGSVTITNGEVGQAFSFDPASGTLIVPDSPNLRLTNQLTIEAWINTRSIDADRAIVSKVGGADGNNGYQLALSANMLVGQFNSPGQFWPSSRIQCALPIAVGVWNHAAWTYDQSAMKLYWNGIPVATNVIGPKAIATSGSDLRISGDDNNHVYFDGLIDEPSVYSRALSASEIAVIYNAGAGGKCKVSMPPFIIMQPVNQVVTVGGSVTLSVVVGGTPPLSYQWSLGGSALDGATNASLTLTNVQFSQAGNYSVVITNVAGTASSSNATLSVNFPPASVRVVNVTNAQSGATVNVPVSLAANGNENGLSFSLNFDTTKLTYVSIALGSGAIGANMLTNVAQAASGKLGVILTLQPDQTFATGTQELVQVTFMTAVRTNDFSTTLSFGDDPIVRQLSGASGNVLAAAYASGLVLIQAAEFEGDIAPRPNGDKAVTVTDWVLAGRYAARLDYPTNAAEFQRADCAPRATLGDGEITVIDWVQVGLYAAGLDPLTVAGGPTSEVPPVGNISGKGSGSNTPHGDSPPPTSRLLEVADTMVIQGMASTVSVNLESQGDENAIGFSLLFDPGAFTYESASLGSSTTGGTLFANASQASAGRLGFVLGLGIGNSFTAGTREVLKVNLRSTAVAAGNYTVAFGSQPLPCEVSDASAQRLAADYVSGTITVNPLPSLKVGLSGTNITLAWPLWATNFGLQAAEGGLPPAAGWTNVNSVPTLTTNEAIATLPLPATNAFYRLHQQ